MHIFSVYQYCRGNGISIPIPIPFPRISVGNPMRFPRGNSNRFSTIPIPILLGFLSRQPCTVYKQYKYKYLRNSFVLVPALPTNLNSTNITSTSFCVAFNPPTNITQNGLITSYTVTYQGELFNTTEYNTTVSVSPVVYPLTESSSVCISDLEEYNNYTVLIRANNGAGEGAAAMIIVKTAEAGLF